MLPVNDDNEDNDISLSKTIKGQNPSYLENRRRDV